MMCVQVWAWAYARLGQWLNPLAVILAVVYNILAHCVVVASIVNLDLPPYPSLILALEQV